MENLKKEILAQIPQYDDKINWYGIEEFENLIYEKDGFKIYGDAVQAALDKYKCVKIEKREDMYIEKPIIMGSGYKLKLDKEQNILNVPETNSCMVRNKNIVNGEFKPAVHQNYDQDITVDGGIWDGGLTDAESNVRFGTGLIPEYKGAMAIMIFVNIENLIIKNAEFRNGGTNYAVELGSIKSFKIYNLTFLKYGRDGVHINGPASFGEVCDLYGKDMGDDMVALNAWDWDASAVTFGTIENIYVHDNKSSNNELRLLPGRKMYEDSYVDCDIKNCILERLTGIYTFKLYCQPNIRNAIQKGYDDSSGTVGNISNVWFKDIKINENKASGFHGLPVNGVFDVCCNCNNIHFENIFVEDKKETLESKEIKFVSVGPLSATWKNDSENPEDWGEVFAPDSVCFADNIYFNNISFIDGKAENAEELVKEVKLEINPDYPNTTPKGGTGYGKIGKVHFIG